MIYHLLEKKNVKDGNLAFCEEGIELGSFIVAQKGGIFCWSIPWLSYRYFCGPLMGVWAVVDEE